MSPVSQPKAALERTNNNNNYIWQPTSLYILHLRDKKQLSIPPGGSSLYSSLKVGNRQKVANDTGEEVEAEKQGGFC